MAAFYDFYDEAAKYYDEAYNDPFYCSECDMLFVSSAQFFYHTVEHNYCAGCEKKFKSKAGIGKHISENPKCLNWLRRSVGDSSEDDEPSKQGLQGSTSTGTSHDQAEGNTNKNSKCARCKIQFGTPAELKAHLLKSRMHKICHKCQMDLPSQMALNEHFRVSHPCNSELKSKTANVMCCFCSKSIGTQENLEKHLQFEHFRCFSCEREFTSAKALADHFSSSKRHNYCKSCDTDFLLCSSLKEHSLSHLTEKLNSMNIHNTADTESNYIPEWDELIEDDDDGSCLQCLEQFDSLLDKQWHEFDCHLTCLYCPKQFANRKSFNEHLLTYAGRFYCWECNDYTPFWDPRIQHQSLNEEETENFYEDLLKKEVAVQKKIYLCDECDEDYTFKSPEELEAHLSTNHFPCRKCDEDFPSKQALAHHTKVSSQHGYCDLCKRSN